MDLRTPVEAFLLDLELQVEGETRAVLRAGDGLEELRDGGAEYAAAVEVAVGGRGRVGVGVEVQWGWWWEREGRRHGGEGEGQQQEREE